MELIKTVFVEPILGAIWGMLLPVILTGIGLMKGAATAQSSTSSGINIRQSVSSNTGIIIGHAGTGNQITIGNRTVYHHYYGGNDRQDSSVGIVIYITILIVSTLFAQTFAKWVSPLLVGLHVATAFSFGVALSGLGVLIFRPGVTALLQSLLLTGMCGLASYLLLVSEARVLNWYPWFANQNIGTLILKYGEEVLYVLKHIIGTVLLALFHILVLLRLIGIVSAAVWPNGDVPNWLVRLARPAFSWLGLLIFSFLLIISAFVLQPEWSAWLAQLFALRAL